MNKRTESMALGACRALVMAYKRGKANGGHISWEEVDQAYRLAAQAIKHDKVAELMGEEQAEQ